MAMASRGWWRAAGSVVLALGLWPATAASAEVVEANLEVFGHTDLGDSGPYGDVAVVGTTAIVAAGGGPAAAPGCPQATAKVVDLKDQKRPVVVAVVAMPAGTAAVDVDAAYVSTPAFTGDLVAIALANRASCGETTGGDVVYYDVTDPAQPRFLAGTPGCQSCGPGPHSVSVALRRDGRALSLRTGGAGVSVDDVSDPVRPAPLGRWAPDGARRSQTENRCPATGSAAPAALHDEGEGAVAVFDGRLYHLDLSEPATPWSTHGAPLTAEDGAGTGSAAAGVMPLGNRTLAIVSEDGSGEGCSQASRGLRVFELSRGASPSELSPVRLPSPAGPGRLVTSGELAFVAWHGDGLRVIDFGQVRPRTIAQFVPAQADVVGVALLRDQVVVTDATSGLYVLQRPQEGGRRSSFWSDLAGLLPYLGFAGVLAALFVVPRLAAGRAGAGAGREAPAPTPARVPRRRA